MSISPYPSDDAMTVREELDYVLKLIKAPSLTDFEFSECLCIMGENDDKEHAYQALYAVLVSRGGADGPMERLRSYYANLGVDTAGDGDESPFYNILIGASL